MSHKKKHNSKRVCHPRAGGGGHSFIKIGHGTKPISSFMMMQRALSHREEQLIAAHRQIDEPPGTHAFTHPSMYYMIRMIVHNTLDEEGARTTRYRNFYTKVPYIHVQSYDIVYLLPKILHPLITRVNLIHFETRRR